MRIAVYSGIIPSTVFIEKLITELAETGHEVYLFGQIKGKKPTYSNKLIKVFPMPGSFWQAVFFIPWYQFQLLVSNPGNFFALKKHIQSQQLGFRKRTRLWAKLILPVLHQPDVFHIQWAKSLADWFFLKELFGVKLAVSLRGSQINISPQIEPETEALYQRLFPKVDGFHAVSHAIAERAIGLGAQKERIQVIYSAQKTRELIRLNTTKEPCRLISVGRFHWVKGYSLALEAVKHLKDAGVSLHYTIIGKGKQEEILLQIQLLGLQDCVSLQAEKPHTEVLQLMAESDIMVLPSYEEGIANVVLEAMSMGLPVVSSNCGGMQEAITDGETGFLFESGHAQELASKIQLCYSQNPEIKAAMVKKAQEHIRNNFSESAFKSGFSRFYTQMADTN